MIQFSASEAINQLIWSQRTCVLFSIFPNRKGKIPNKPKYINQCYYKPEYKWFQVK